MPRVPAGGELGEPLVTTAQPEPAQPSTVELADVQIASGAVTEQILPPTVDSGYGERGRAGCCVRIEGKSVQRVSKMTLNRLLHVFFMATAVAGACASVWDPSTNDTQDSKEIELAQLSGALFGIGLVTQMGIPLTYRDVLVELGIESGCLTLADRKWLDTVATFLCVPILFFVAQGIRFLSLAAAASKPVDQVWYFSVGLYNLFGGPCTTVFLMCMFYGSTLATRSILNLTERIHNIIPSDPAWKTVYEEAVVLAAEIMPAVSSGFGPPIASFSATYCLFGMSEFVYWLSVGTLQSAVFTVLSFAFALVVVWPLAAISTRCDQLMTALNNNRLKHINISNVEAQIVSMETALRRLNLEQGLGFTVFGSVVDKRKLVKAAITLVSVAPPIFAALTAFRPDQIGDQATIGQCSLDPEPLAALARVAATLDARCVYNITISHNLITSI